MKRALAMQQCILHKNLKKGAFISKDFLLSDEGFSTFIRQDFNFCILVRM